MGLGQKYLSLDGKTEDLSPCVNGTEHPKVLVFLGVKTSLDVRRMCTVKQSQNSTHYVQPPFTETSFTKAPACQAVPGSPAHGLPRFLSASHIQPCSLEYKLVVACGSICMGIMVVAPLKNPVLILMFVLHINASLSLSI